MRVVWKDTVKPIQIRKYRKHILTRHELGWIVDVPGDNNIYKAISDVYNMLDAMEIDGVVKIKPPSRADGIRIVGTINE